MPRRRPPAAYLTRRRWTIIDARDALAAWEASGRSLSEFARRTGLEVKRLYRWRERLAADRSRRIRRPEEMPEFVELRPRPQVVEQLPRDGQPVEVVLRSGRILRVAETIDPLVLLRLVRALEDDPAC